MSNLKNIVYLTEAQYTILKMQGILTVGDITLIFDEDTLYLTPQENAQGVTVLVGGTAIDTLTFDADPQTQINTIITSLTDYIKHTDFAVDKGAAGIVTTDRSTYGIGASTNGLLFIDGASKPQILDKGSAFKPITPNNIDYAVKVGLTTNKEEWSDAEKVSARALIEAFSSKGGVISGDVTITGNITQQGEAYETHAEQVYSTKDYIYLREGNTGGLAEGAYTGFEFKKYDGTNNGRLVVDSSGVARVGDVGDEQPLATREEAPVDGGFAKWDSVNNKFITTVDVITSTDYATDEKAGIARWVTGFGLKVDQYGRGHILQATNDEITAKTQEYKPITPKNLDFAILQGLTNNANTLTDEQKTAIENWLGISDSLNFAEEHRQLSLKKNLMPTFNSTNVTSVVQNTSYGTTYVDYTNKQIIFTRTGGLLYHTTDVTISGLSLIAGTTYTLDFIKNGTLSITSVTIDGTKVSSSGTFTPTTDATTIVVAVKNSTAKNTPAIMSNLTLIEGSESVGVFTGTNTLLHKSDMGQYRYVVESYLSSDGLTWYRKWSDSWKECGGVHKAYLSTYLKTITLPLSFSDTNYTKNITFESTGNGEDTFVWWIYDVGDYATTVNSFSVRCRTNLSTMNYYCCGY